MRNRLPIYIENLELPKNDNIKMEERKSSYGYVSIFYLLSLLITLGSVLTVIFLGK